MLGKEKSTGRQGRAGKRGQGKRDAGRAEREATLLKAAVGIANSLGGAAVSPANPSVGSATAPAAGDGDRRMVVAEEALGTEEARGGGERSSASRVLTATDGLADSVGPQADAGGPVAGEGGDEEQEGAAGGRVEEGAGDESAAGEPGDKSEQPAALGPLRYEASTVTSRGKIRSGDRKRARGERVAMGGSRVRGKCVWKKCVALSYRQLGSLSSCVYALSISILQNILRGRGKGLTDRRG